MNEKGGRPNDVPHGWDTIGSGADPVLDIPSRKRRALLVVLTTAVVVGAGTGVVGIIAFLRDEPVASTNETDTVRPGELAVFLCARTSANPGCVRSDATAAETQQVKATLQAVPGVSKVVFEDHEAAYRRFRERFGDQEQFRGIRAEDLPTSFRVEFTSSRQAERIKAAVRGRPGVDQVIIGKG